MQQKKLSKKALTMIARRFKVLSEPIRLQILHSLQEGEKSVSDLATVVQTSQPNISKHLKIMQTAGILSREQHGNTVYYKIADESIFILCETVCNALEEDIRNQAEIFLPV